jgi:hypothetical protein
MAAARAWAEACLTDPAQGHVDALQFPTDPSNPYDWTAESIQREQGVEETPVLTPGQTTLAMAALHAVHCPSCEAVISLAVDVPKLDAGGQVTDEYCRAVRWWAIKDRVRGLGDYALPWFTAQLRRFKRDLASVSAQRPAHHSNRCGGIADPGTVQTPLTTAPVAAPSTVEAMTPYPGNESEGSMPLSYECTPPAPDFDLILERTNRRREIIEQLGDLEKRFIPKKERVAEVLRRFQAALPMTSAFSGDPATAVIPPDRREAIADVLMDMCRTIRQAEFSEGIEQILAQDHPEVGDNARIAFHLYRLGWTGNREGILGFLARLEKLPKQADNFDATAPCQREVWKIISDRLDIIMPFPFMNAWTWHPDVSQAMRLQAELSAQPPRQQVDAAQPTVSRPPPSDPATVMLEAIRHARLLCDGNSSCSSREFVWQSVVNNLWKTWREQFPADPPPVRPTCCQSYQQTSDAFDALLRALEAVQARVDHTSPSRSEDRTMPKIPQEKVKVLFFAANPAGTAPLALDEEAREIEAKIRASEHRHSLELLTKWAARPDDLLQFLNQHEPTIVHFSGHGSQAAEIVLLDNNRQPTPVGQQALAALFRALKGKIRVVFLNACFTQPQAEAIVQEIDCAVGMGWPIRDEAAITFAASFYRALGFGKSVQNAFDQAKVALQLASIPEESVPHLLARPGVDPDQVFVVNPR